MSDELAKRLLELLYALEDPINDIVAIVSDMEDQQERKRLIKCVGEVMGILDGEMAYPLRLQLGLAE